MSPRVRMIVATMLFLGWMGWLGFAALNKSRGPVVSRAQAAATSHPVIAEVKDGNDGRPSQFVIVVEALTENGPATGSEQFITNLPATTGYQGPGQYLLMLTPDPVVVTARPDGPTLTPYLVVGQQRSPAYEMAGVGPPMIYANTRDVHGQATKLFK